MYVMKAAASSVYWNMLFPQNDKIRTVDQLTYYDPKAQLNPTN